MQSFFMVAGGLGLFLFGMKIMSDGLEKIAGKKLQKILQKGTSNSFFAVLVGIIITIVVQSSSVTTIMVIGFVNAGLINLTQSIAIIIGANIGTTFGAQIFAFRIDSIAPLFIFFGSITYLFSKQEKFKNIGFVILGISILFFGMTVMGTPMSQLAQEQYFRELVTRFDNPLLAFFIGLILTAIIQSSSAIMGILVAMYLQGIVFPFETAVFIILGSNIGTCVDTMIASIPTNRESKQAALAHLFYNLITCLIVAFLIIIYPSIILWIQNVWSDQARQVVMFHTIFNIFVAIIFLPFIKPFAKLIDKIIPKSKKRD